jgi:hypothetical protein
MSHEHIVARERCEQKTAASKIGTLSVLQRNSVLKSYWKYENLKEVQRQMQDGFRIQPPTRRKIDRIRNKFEADGIFHDVHKQRFGRPRILTGPASRAVVLQQLTRSPQNICDSVCTRKWGKPIKCAANF